MAQKVWILKTKLNPIETENEVLREKIMVLERRVQLIQDAISNLVRKVK